MVKQIRVKPFGLYKVIKISKLVFCFVKIYCSNLNSKVSYFIFPKLQIVKSSNEENLRG